MVTNFSNRPYSALVSCGELMPTPIFVFAQEVMDWIFLPPHRILTRACMEARRGGRAARWRTFCGSWVQIPSSRSTTFGTTAPISGLERGRRRGWTQRLVSSNRWPITTDEWSVVFETSVNNSKHNSLRRIGIFYTWLGNFMHHKKTKGLGHGWFLTFLWFKNFEGYDK